MALVKLFNRGKRTIRGKHANGGRKYAFRPDTAAAFEKADAEKLLKMYGGEILSVESIQQQFADDAGASAPAPAPVAPVAPPPVAPPPSEPAPADEPPAPAPADEPAQDDTSGQGEPPAAQPMRLRYGFKHDHRR